MATAKMKPPGFIAVISYLTCFSVVYAQQNLGQFSLSSLGIQREIFVLNLEDGYFGCQVNSSADVLQLFEVSKLCDGVPNCYRGSDENINELKCTNDCPYTKGYECINGACLDHQCHCNDGYGGCGCEKQDENECKYRPCDVFAACTNTLGSYFCSCFPGYEGDGNTCEDIDECLIPENAARCHANGECCNMPAHYYCKCSDGFQGDGYDSCVDINECQSPDACGSNAICNNFIGNYTCTCPEGYIGNPFDGCVDFNECEKGDACGPLAKCQNRAGGHDCDCPLGYEGDPYSRSGCLDINECLSNPCARSALCTDGANNFTCACPLGFIGDPYNQFGSCQDINECTDPLLEFEDDSVTTMGPFDDFSFTTIFPDFLNDDWTPPCGTNASCINIPGSFKCRCPSGFSGIPEVMCTDINECGDLKSCGLNSKCINVPGSYKCFCPDGFEGDGNAFCSS